VPPVPGIRLDVEGEMTNKEASDLVERIVRDEYPELEFVAPIVGANDIFLPVQPDSRPARWKVWLWAAWWLGLWCPPQRLVEMLQAPYERKCEKHDDCRLTGNLFVFLKWLRDEDGEEMLRRTAEGCVRNIQHVMEKHNRKPKPTRGPWPYNRLRFVGKP